MELEPYVLKAHLRKNPRIPSIREVILGRRGRSMIIVFGPKKGLQKHAPQAPMAGNHRKIIQKS